MSKQFPVIMITGSRQVGKSTLLNYISSNEKTNINYVTLDNIRNRALALEDPELFLETFKPSLTIDEFQYVPNLLSYIKIIVDETRIDELFNDGEKIKTLYYLTGLQNFLAMEEVTESLAGRIGIIDLYGLSNRKLIGIGSRLFIPEIEEL